MNKLIISSIVIYIYILKQSRIVVGGHFFNLKLKTQKNWRKTLFTRIGGLYFSNLSHFLIVIREIW